MKIGSSNPNLPAYLKARSEMQATMGSDISIPFRFAEIEIINGNV